MGRIADQILLFLWVVAQVEEDRFTACVVSQFPIPIDNHPTVRDGTYDEFSRYRLIQTEGWQGLRVHLIR